MKVLLDGNLPHQLRHEIVGHDVYTTAYMGWSGVENGKLLRIAAEGGFDVIVANDHGLEYQQNAATLPLSVVVLLVKSNTIEAIRPLLPELQRELLEMPPRSFRKIGGQ